MHKVEDYTFADAPFLADTINGLPIGFSVAILDLVRRGGGRGRTVTES